MDILAHGLWTGILCKVANKKMKNPVRVKRAIFWGMFPDILAFAPQVVWIIVSLLLGRLDVANVVRVKDIEPPQADALPLFGFTTFLYSISHSLPIFLVVFSITFLIFRRIVWELTAWPFHILLDVFSHDYSQLYLPPFLWPLSAWRFDGISWRTPLFLFLNYSALLVAYLLLRRSQKGTRSTGI